MGRNRLTPEQALDKFKSKFAELYPNHTLECIIKEKGTNVTPTSATLALGLAADGSHSNATKITCFGSIAPGVFTSIESIDWHMTRVLEACVDVKRTCDEPVKNAYDAHRLTACVDNNLKYLSEQLKKASDEVDKKTQ